MIQGFIDGIKNMLGNVGNAISSVGEKIKNFLHFSRPDEGPLREYEKWMPDMIQGLTNTLEKAAPKLYRATKNVAQRMSEELDLGEISNGIQTDVTRNVTWKDKNLNMEPQAYSISSQTSKVSSKLQAQGETSYNAEILLQKLVDILLVYFPQFSELMNKEIVLEDGTLVGKLTPKIDKELSDENDKRRRGN